MHGLRVLGSGQNNYQKQVVLYIKLKGMNIVEQHALRQSVDIFSYSGPSGILGFDGKQNIA